MQDYQHPFLNPFPRVCAHRGDSIKYPENTLEAFVSAAELGVDLIESDVHLSADGECILWHDSTVDRMTDGSGSISSFTLAELKELDAGWGFSDQTGNFPFRGRGSRIPTLSETLEALPHTRFNIDLKDKSRRLARRFVDTVYAHQAQHRVLGASFHYRQVRRVRAMAPEIITSFAKAEVRIMMIQMMLKLPMTMSRGARILQVPVYSGKVRIVTPELVRKLHRRHRFIQVWTINDPEEMKSLLDMGVDGIISDDPATLLKVISKEI